MIEATEFGVGRNCEDPTGYDNRWVLGALARQSELNKVPRAEYLDSSFYFVLGALIIERASKEELNAFFRSVLFEVGHEEHTMAHRFS